jgi:hypothetical protein
MKYHMQQKIALETAKSSQLCQLCEWYASTALYYHSGNKTQSEIISALSRLLQTRIP